MKKAERRRARYEKDPKGEEARQQRKLKKRNRGREIMNKLVETEDVD
jgi:hypothetical protein